MAWRNGCEEVTQSKPLFLTIYTVVIIGIVVSSFYVFSAIYSSNTPASQSSAWLSSSISTEDPPRIDQTLNISQPQKVPTVSTPSPEKQNVRPNSLWEIPPSNKKMPPLNDFRLTNELVQKRVKDNVIIVTFGNYAFMDFILTWVKKLTDLEVSNFLVGAMDTKLLEALYWKGVPVFDMGSHMSTVDVGWGTPTFHKMGREKVILIDSILPFGFEVLMCDTDMVWLKNPLPYLARHPEADILTSSDQVVPTVVDDSLEIWQEVSGAYNIGIFHWRPTESAKILAKKWKEMLLADDKIWDQNGFNDILHSQLGPSVDDDSGLVYTFNGKLKLGILPASIFCSGHTYFVQAMYQQLRLEPYAVHTTFQYGGTEGKRHRLREAMQFLDPPEYYNPPGGLLSFKPSIPKSMLLSGEHNIESHFTLINHQTKQIRTALAIASLLNRTLVVPPLWCRLDRMWYPHPGILEGSMTRQPFLCPLDHVFEVNVMLKKLPEEEFGPEIGIREYSMLDNPSLPLEVKKSWLDVQLCKEGKKFQSKFRKVKEEMNRWDEFQSCLISQFRNAGHILDRLQVLQMSNNYGTLNCVSGVRDALLEKQIGSLNNILVSMRRTLEKFHCIVASLEKIHRDGRQLVKGSSSRTTMKQLQQRVGIKPRLIDCLDGLLFLHEIYYSEYLLKSSVVSALSAMAIMPSASDLGMLQQLLDDEPNLRTEEVQFLLDTIFAEELC